MCEYILILQIEIDQRRRPNKGYAISTPEIQIDILHDH